MNRHPRLVSFIALLVIAGSGWITWKRHASTPDFPVPLHQAIGDTLAVELMRAVNGTGEVLVITLDDSDSAILATQLGALRQALDRSRRLRIGKQVAIDPGKRTGYQPGAGLSVGKLSREIEKFPEAVAVVSLVGLPAIEDSDLKALGSRRPPLFGVCRDRRKLESLARHHWVHTAIVPRFEFPAPESGTPHLPQEWFDRQFQLIRFTPTLSQAAR